MANLIETDEFPATIYQLEDSDPVSGGPPNPTLGDGWDNLPHLQLTNRTRWLYNRVQTLLAAVVPATTAIAGIVRLSSSTSSTSTNMAATPAAVKSVADAAGAANANANAAHAAIAGAGVPLAVEVSNLDALTGTHVFYAGDGATGIPVPGRDYRGLHLTSQSGAEHSQIVFGGTNLAAWRDFDDPGVGWGPWQYLMSSTSGVYLTWSTADAPDGWIVAESIRGDTDVTLGAVEATCTRYGNMAAVSLRLTVSGFSVPVPSDDPITFELDVRSLGMTAGFWGTGIAGGGRAVAMGQLYGDTYDSPSVLFEVTANPATGRLTISNGDMTHMPAQASPATSLRIDLQITLLVAD